MTTLVKHFENKSPGAYVLTDDQKLYASNGWCVLTVYYVNDVHLYGRRRGYTK